MIQREMQGVDSVFLEGMSFYGYHGVHAAEQSLGQRFLVDVTLATDLRPAGRSDDLTRTINYSAVYRRVCEIVEGPPRQLIEAVAEEIAMMLLAEFRAASVTVTLRKPNAPIKDAVFDAAGVRVVRARNDMHLERD